MQNFKYVQFVEYQMWNVSAKYTAYKFRCPENLSNRLTCKSQIDASIFQ